MGREDTHNGFLEWAEFYAALGWAVIQLPRASKLPFKGSHAYKDGTTDPGNLRRWWAALPDGNIGIVTGRQSGIVVVDIDNDLAGDLQLPRTSTVITGGGGNRRHFYFSYDLPLKTFTFLGNHLKADGGYVVAPGSVHPDTGNVYRWAPGLGIDERPLAPLTSELLEQVQALARKSGTANPNASGRGGHRKRTRRAGQREEGQRGTRESTFSTAPRDWPYKEYFKQEKVALAILRACGAKIEKLGKFLCIFHPEARASMAIYRLPDGVIAARHLHPGPPDDPLPDGIYLPECFARRIYGLPIPLETAPELSIWGIRCLYELEFIDLPELAFPVPQVALPPAAQKVYAKFLYCAACREAHHAGQAFDWVPFARGFASHWSGLQPATVRNGLEQLCGRKILEKDLRTPSSGRAYYWYRFTDAAMKGPRAVIQFPRLHNGSES